MNDSVFDALRALDPSPEYSVDDTAQRRRTARLEQILDTPTSPAASRSISHGARRRWLLVTAGLAAATAGIIAPSVWSSPTNAYASWTAVPDSVTSADRAVATQACQQRTAAQEQAESTPAKAWSELVTERRGNWVTVALSDQSTSNSISTTQDMATITTCLIDLPPAATAPVGEVAYSAAGWSYGPILANHMYSAGLSFTLPTTHEPGVMTVQGSVGSGVVGMQIITPAGEKVTATVNHGIYTAWWPITDAPTATTPEPVYYLTLQDGSHIRAPEPSHNDDGS